MCADFSSENTLSQDSLMLDDSLENSSVGLPDILDNDDKCTKSDRDDPMGYLDREVFPILLPCLEEVLFAANENDVLKVQKSRFNGLDYLAELLWNRNLRHPERNFDHIPIFEIPFAKKYLENNPRPVYPKSWLWTPAQAAVVIQSAVRGYFVRRLPQIQELRSFWKILAKEKKAVICSTSEEENEECFTTF